MKEINDIELDDLIMASVERQQRLEGLNQAIVKDVRQRARRVWVKRWGRIVVFSFGLPIVTLIFALTMLHLYTTETSFLVRTCLFIPTLVMVWGLNREIRNFSIAQM